MLPVTVQDQIRLWELERNRLKSQEGKIDYDYVYVMRLTVPFSGYLYKDFASQADYEFVLSYAKELDVVIWENAARRCFFGSLDGHANIRSFIERRTAAAG